MDLTTMYMIKAALWLIVLIVALGFICYLQDLSKRKD